jgi:hypothetical protein
METRQINNTSTEKVNAGREMYETIIGEDSIEIIAYKFQDGETTQVKTGEDTNVVAEKYLTLDAYLTRSLDEMADGLMTIKPEFTVKEDVQVLEDRVTVKISK